MRPRSRLVAAVVLLGLAGLAGWWLARPHAVDPDAEGPILESALTDEAFVLPASEAEERAAMSLGSEVSATTELAADPVLMEGYFAGFPADAVLPMRVHGRLVDPDGAPWPDAIVRLAWSPRIRSLVRERHAGAEPDFHSTITDAEGRFDLTTPRLIRLGVKGGMVPAERLPPCLVVVDPRCAVTISDELQGLDEAELGALVVARGGAVSGRVVDAAGQPIGGAEVSQPVPDVVPASLLRTRTDAQGRFMLTSLDPGAGAMVVEAVGFVSRGFEGLPVVTGGVVQLLDTVLAREDPVVGTLAGRVLDSRGEPIAGASVRSFGQDWGLEARDGSWRFGLQRTFVDACFWTRSTDADGHFAIAGIEGAREILAWAPGFAPVLQHDVMPGTVDLELRLPAEPVVRLLLRDAAGRAVDADEIHVRWQDADGQLSPDLPCRRLGSGIFGVATDRDGGLDVWASAPGCAVTRKQLVLPPAGDVTLTLEAESTLEGRVVDEVGTPVPCTWVELKLYSAPCAADRSVLTGNEGAFRATRLRAGSWQIRLLAKDHAETALPDFRIEGGERRKGEVLVLPRAAEIRGVVRHEDGVPMQPSAEWGFDDELVLDLLPDGERRRAEVSSRGEFSAQGLAAGRWQIRLGELAQTEVDVSAGAVTQADLVVPRWPVVRGRVLQAGQPVAQARLFYKAAVRSEEFSAAAAAARTGGASRSEDDGSFVFPVHGTGRFSVWAGVHGGGRSPSVDLDLVAGEQRELVLQLGTASIRGRIICAQDGLPVKASVGLRGELPAASAEDGSFLLHGLLPGTYDVVAQMPLGLPAEVCGLRVGEGETREGVELAVPPPRGDPCR